MPPDPKETKRGAPAAPATDVTPTDPEQASDDNSGDEEMDELGELDMSSAEFYSINESLDSLSSALDNIERKNDSLREQVLLLLESQREMRKSFKEENSRQPSGQAEQTTGEPQTAEQNKNSGKDRQAIEAMEES